LLKSTLLLAKAASGRASAKASNTAIFFIGNSPGTFHGRIALGRQDEAAVYPVALSTRC
jgi:hypothetical protein